MSECSCFLEGVLEEESSPAGSVPAGVTLEASKGVTGWVPESPEGLAPARTAADSIGTSVS